MDISNSGQHGEGPENLQEGTMKYEQKVVVFYGSEIEKRVFDYLKECRPQTKVIVQFQDKETKVVSVGDIEWEEKNPSNSSAY